MPDVIRINIETDTAGVARLAGAFADAVLPLLALASGYPAMSDSMTAFLDAVRTNRSATGSLAQGLDAFRRVHQARLDDTMTKLADAVNARVSAVAERDALLAQIEQARAEVVADTADTAALVDAIKANTPIEAEPAPEPTPTEPTPAEPPVVVEPAPETPVDAAPAEPAPVDAAPVVETPVDAAPVETPVEAAPTDGAAPPVLPPADGTEPAPAPAV